MAHQAAVRVFYCYAHEDKKLRDELEKHLGVLKKSGQITEWYDHEIKAGTAWEQEIDSNLKKANIILLLISPDFLHSDYCYHVEMKRALERHATGSAYVLPIILRAVDWENTPFSALQVLPTGGEPITLWSNTDEALRDVARGVRKVVETLSPQAPFLERNSLKRRLPHDEDSQRRYLRRTILETEKLILKGIPAGLIAQSVRLDEVFIPLEFRPNRPLTDYPLTESELQEYHELVKNGSFPEVIERVLFEAEKSWHYPVKKQEKMTITTLWKRLTRAQPACVIQGFPGMGKSTFLMRLTLYMARRCLRQSDQILPKEVLAPLLIPIFLSLGDYARAREEMPTLSLKDYLVTYLGQLNIPHLAILILHHIENGHSLVLLDGLDEVSNQQMRVQIQEEIRSFVFNYRDTVETSKDFNRFIITSRIAGYDQGAFPDYLHYTIAELTESQIEQFVHSWYQANAYRHHDVTTIDQEDRKNALALEASHQAKDLISAIKEQRAIQDLAENPLLLTLLAVMQQNSIELPRRRVELYRVITVTLLENRNIAKGLPIIPEIQTVQRLGPLAFQMQATGNSFARRNEVLSSLKAAIRSEGGNDEEVEREAELFLQRIRERAGLFALRTADYFGFFHRTFQEYFAARHMLNKIKYDPVQGIQDLVNKASQSDQLWREPFLLAVAYKSNEDETTASQIVRVLLGTAIEEKRPQSYTYGFEVTVDRNLQLTFECLMESKPFTIEAALEREIATRLLQIYMDDMKKAHTSGNLQYVEKAFLRWLQSLPIEAYRPAVLSVLSEAIMNNRQAELQLATLVLLVMIAEHLAPCSPAVFNTFISPLLALAGLPGIGIYQPATDLQPPVNLVISDLATAALAYMGKQGPAGILLSELRLHFIRQPEQLAHLVHSSLQHRMLLIPTVLPQESEKKRLYKAAFSQWKTAVKTKITSPITEKDIEESISIYQRLFNLSEEVYYPTTLYLLDMFQATESHPDRPWRSTCEDYLAQQLATGTYTSYQEVAMLWVFFLSDEQSLQRLATIILDHYIGSNTERSKYAKKLFSTIISDMAEIRHKDNEDAQMQEMSYGRNYEADMRLHNYPEIIRHLSNLQDLKNMEVFAGVPSIRDLDYSIRESSTVSLGYMYTLNLLETAQLGSLRKILLSRESVRKLMPYLVHNRSLSSTSSLGSLDVLAILYERLTIIQATKEIGDLVTDELSQIVSFICDDLSSARKDDKKMELRLGIIRNLPNRSVDEIKVVLQLAKKVNNTRVQEACATLLKNAIPKTLEMRLLLLTALEELSDEKR